SARLAFEPATGSTVKRALKAFLVPFAAWGKRNASNLRLRAEERTRIWNGTVFSWVCSGLA
ncbi:MAG: hypothetical protein LBL79_13125, partial [Prevotella sp.]|nr:hypothetical protein [Prevotella sp.]